MADVGDLTDTYTLELTVKDGITPVGDAVAQKLAGIEASASKAAAAVLGAGDAMGEAGAKITAVDQQWERLASRNDAVTAAANRLAAAEKLLSDATAAADRAIQLGSTSREDANRTLQKLSDNVAVHSANLIKTRDAVAAATVAEQAWRGAHEQSVAAIRASTLSDEAKIAALNKETVAYAGHIQAVKGVTESTTGASFANRQLGVQMIQLFSSIQAGQPVLTALIQQGHQVADVAISSGDGLGVFSRALRAVLSPVGLLVTAVGAVTAAMGLFGIAAENTKRQQATMAAALSATRKDFAEVAAGAEESSKRIAASTTATREEANKMFAAFAANPGVATSQIEELEKTAIGLSRAMGTDLVASTKLVTQALGDPVKAATDLAAAGLRTMDSVVLGNVLHLAQIGDRAGATRLVLAAMGETARTAADQQTPLQEALNKLSEAFHKLGGEGESWASSLGGVMTQFVTGFVRDLVNLLENLERFRAWIKANTGTSGSGTMTEEEFNKPLLERLGIIGPRQPGQTLGDYNNNPLNLRALPGQRGSGQFQQFGSMEEGIAAAARQLQFNQSNHGIMTLGGQITRWAPPSENDTGAYIASVSRATGIDPNAQLNTQDRDVLAKVITAMAQVEIHKLLDPAVVARGVAAAFTGANAQKSSSSLTADEALTAARASQAKLALQGASAATDILAQEKSVAELTQRIKELQAAKDAILNKETISDADQAQVVRYDTAIAQATVSLKNAIDPTRQQTLAIIDQARAAGILGEADRKLFETQAAIAAQRRDNPQGPMSDEAAAAQLAAVTNELAAGYTKLTAAQDVQIKNADAVAKAWEQGGHAAAELEARQTAVNTASQYFASNSPELIKAIEDQTNRTLELASANEKTKAGQESFNLRGQTELLKLEIDTLGMNADARSTLISHMQNEIAVRTQYITLSEEGKEKLIAERDAVDQLKLSYQAQADTLSFFENSFTSAFNTIGNAMAQAFVQGQGAAVNWGNVMKAVIQQVIQKALELSLLNPIINNLFGGQGGRLLPDILSIGALGGGGGSSAGGTVLTGAGLLNSGGISNFMSTPLTGVFGGASTFGPVTSGAASGGAGLGFGAASVGSLLGGGALGFGAGALLGNLTQNAFGRTGPSPQIGAGLGAGAGLAFSALGGPIGLLAGGLLGGALGGGLGGLIGPRPASNFSSTGIGISNGLLSVGASSQQGAASSLAETTAAVNELNTILRANSVAITSLSGITQIGTNTPGGFQDPSKAGSVAGSFSSFRFSSADPGLNRQLAGQSFGSPAELQALIDNFNKAQTAITSFLTDIPTQLAAMGKSAGSLADQVAQTEQPFNAAIAQAQAYRVSISASDEQINQLARSEEDLTAARQKATQAVIEAAQAALNETNQNIGLRLIQAQAKIDPSQAATATMYALNVQQQQESAQFAASLVATFGEAFRQTEQYVKEMTLLETTHAAERLAIQKSINDQIAASQAAAQQAQAAAAAQAAQAAQQAAAQEAAAAQALAAQEAAAAQAAQAAIERLYAAVLQLSRGYESVAARGFAAEATLGVRDPTSSSLYAFDAQANQQRQDLVKFMIDSFGEGITATESFVTQMVNLENTLSLERLVIVRQTEAQQKAAVQNVSRTYDALAARTFNAEVTLGRRDPLSAALYTFDTQAQQQRQDLSKSLTDAFGTQITATQGFVTQMAQLENTLATERLALIKQTVDAQKQATDQARDQATRSAAGVVQSLAQYANSLQVGTASPLSPTSQYQLASNRFNAVSGAARAGNIDSLQQLQSYASTFLTASQTINGSGAQYAADFQKVIGVLADVATIKPDTLTATTFTAETRTATQILNDSLTALKAEVVALRNQIAHNAAAPARIAA